MSLKEHVDIFNDTLYTFKMWLDYCFPNSWYRNCERSMKMYYENVNVLSDQTFLICW